MDFWLSLNVPSGRTVKAVKLYLYEYDADRNSTADTAEKRIAAP